MLYIAKCMYKEGENGNDFIISAYPKASTFLCLPQNIESNIFINYYNTWGTKRQKEERNPY